MIILVIVLTTLLIVSMVIAVLLYKAGIRHLEENELMRNWVTEFKLDVQQTYFNIKALDDREIFSKDDEVGIAFKNLFEIIQKLNERTQDENEE